MIVSLQQLGVLQGLCEVIQAGMEHLNAGDTALCHCMCSVKEFT